MKRLRILTFLVCLIPFVLLLLKVLQNDLGPDPAKELALETGEWSIRFLLLALAMTPLRHLSGPYGVRSAAKNGRVICPFLCERPFSSLGDFSTRPQMGSYS